MTPAALKAKFQSIRDKSGRKAIVLVSDVSKPQRASAVVVEAADGAGLTVKLAKPGEVATAKPQPKPAPKPTAPAGPALSFMKDVAPILVQNCIACHNPKKSESKYMMTTFAQLAKGGQQGEGITLEPGDPDASHLVELIRPDGEPRMPYKQDPLPPEKIALIERWVKEGAKYDGADADRGLGRRPPQVTPVVDPRGLPGHRADHGPGVQARRATSCSRRAITRSTSGSPPTARSPVGSGRWPSGSTRSPTAPTASGSPPPAATPASSARRQLWMAEPDGGGKPVRDLVETTDCVFAVAFSPDSKPLAAAGADRAIRIWEVGTGKELATIEDHADWILDVAFSPDGKRLASASRDKTSKVFDVGKKEALVTFPGHAETVYAVAFSPDGKQRRSAAAATTRSASGTPTTTASSPQNLGGFGGPVFKLQFTRRRQDARRLLGRQGRPRLREPRRGSGPSRATTTGSTPSPSRPTARRSPRGAGTARSASGTSPTASRSGRSSPRPGSSRRPRPPRSERGGSGREIGQNRVGLPGGAAGPAPASATSRTPSRPARSSRSSRSSRSRPTARTSAR